MSSPRAPKAYSACELLSGTLRREVLDRILTPTNATCWKSWTLHPRPGMRPRAGRRHLPQYRPARLGHGDPPSCAPTVPPGRCRAPVPCLRRLPCPPRRLRVAPEGTRAHRRSESAGPRLLSGGLTGHFSGSQLSRSGPLNCPSGARAALASLAPVVPLERGVEVTIAPFGCCGSPVCRLTG
jgi:hypothetical protein